MRFLRFVGILLVIVLVLGAVLFWTAPAEIAYRFARHRIAAIELQGIKGSVWNGSAERAISFGQDLGRVDWTLEKAPLLRGDYAGTLKITGERLDASAQLAGGNRDLALKNLKARIPADVIGPAIDIPALQFLGTIVLDVAEATIKDGLLQTATGSAQWDDMGIRGAAVAALPGLRADFAPNGEGIRATLRDLGGTLAVDGTVDIANGRFLSESRIAVREPNPQLEELLKYVGQREPDGSSYLRIEGELKPLW